MKIKSWCVISTVEFINKSGFKPVEKILDANMLFCPHWFRHGQDDDWYHFPKDFLRLTQIYSASDTSFMNSVLVTSPQWTTYPSLQIIFLGWIYCVAKPLNFFRTHGSRNEEALARKWYIYENRYVIWATLRQIWKIKKWSNRPDPDSRGWDEGQG